MRYLTIGLLLTLSTTQLYGFEVASLSDAQQKCYGTAMIGYDSVINSRLGVPAEHALDLARIDTLQSAGEEAFAADILQSVLGAYMWQNTPHTYAIKVFYECASQGGSLRSAGSGYKD